MKKIFSLIVIFALFAVLLAPLAAMAADEPLKECTVKKDFGGRCPATGGLYKEGDTDFGMCCLLQTIDNVTGWLFFLMSTIAVLLFIIGAVYYMTAGGDPEKAKKGKGIIIYAIIGLVIALVAKMIPSLVTTVIG